MKNDQRIMSLFVQGEIERQYRRLQDLVNQRRKKLNDSKKLFEFYHEADETATWISDKSLIAGSEDYGTDLEHVEVGFHIKLQIILFLLCKSLQLLTKVTELHSLAECTALDVFSGHKN